MNSKRVSDRAGIVVVLVVVCAAGVCAADSIASRWRDREIRIDGVNDEWQDVAYSNDAGAVGAANDDRFLYLSIITSDQQRRRQFAAAGLTVWLDAKGGKKQSFGIRIPGGVAFPGAARGGRRGVGDETPPDVPTPDITYFELLGPRKDDRRRLERTAESGIEVAAGSHEGTLVYELKVPLSKASALPYAIGTQPGRRIGLGLETPKMERPEGGSPREQGGGRGGRGGGGGGGRGGGRGGVGGGGGFGGGRAGRAGAEDSRGQQAKPLKVWTTIQLAPLAK